MRYLFAIGISVILYIGCGNNSNPHVISTDEYIINAIENEEIQEGWDIKENRLSLIEAIKNADKEGLLPEDYQYSKLVEFEDKFILSPDSKDAYYELLTAAFIKYVSNLKNGKINPKEIYTDWEVDIKEIQPDTILAIALHKKRIDSTIESCIPKHTIYKNLKKALVVLNNMPNDNFDSIILIPKEKIYLGVKNQSVAKIKERLRYWGDLNKSDTLANTHYDETLKKGVIHFQLRHGLESDGKIGPATINALNFSKENRRQQIIANLERWRWFPSDLGKNFLGVNLPDYNLQVVENTDTIKTYKVVIGKATRKTPVLSSKVDNIVFNPTWTVPPTIIREDLVPDATKSRSYFYKNRIKIFDYKNNEIAVSSWKPKDAEKYRYVQDPGYNNSLGVVKINFKNDHLVYMHDTNHRELFVKNYRALSSGCVRIEKPLPLAEYLLKDKLKKERIKELVPQKGKKKTEKPVYKTKLVEVPVYSLAEIDTIVQTKKTKAVKVGQNFGIHFLYFTAWYDKEQFQFRHDVYEYDSELYLRLSNQFTSNLVTSTRVIDK